MLACDLVMAREHRSAVAPYTLCLKYVWWPLKPSKRDLQPRTLAAEGRQLLYAHNWKATAACRCPDLFFLNLHNLQPRTASVVVLVFCFLAHHITSAVAYPENNPSQQSRSAIVTPARASGSWDGNYGSDDPPLFHIVWPERPLDLDVMLRHAAEHLKVPWGKKVLAGRLSALTVEEADDFCSRIKFAVEKHLRAVFDASSHFKVFERAPTTTPFLHLDYVRDFVRSQFTRDKIKLSLPDRDLEPLFKHVGGLPWRRSTDAKQFGTQMHDYAESDGGVPTTRYSRSWIHDEL